MKKLGKQIAALSLSAILTLTSGVTSVSFAGEPSLPNETAVTTEAAEASKTTETTETAAAAKEGSTEKTSETAETGKAETATETGATTETAAATEKNGTETAATTETQAAESTSETAQSESKAESETAQSESGTEHTVTSERTDEVKKENASAEEAMEEEKAYAAEVTIDLSQYFSVVNPDVHVNKDDTAKTSGTYNGTLTATIPATDIAEAIGKDQAGFPWGAEYGESGGILVKAVFPDNSTIGDTSCNVGTDAFSSASVHAGSYTINGNRTISYDGDTHAVSILFPFNNAWDFAGIYSYCMQGGEITISIPYTVAVNQGDKLPYPTIDVSGQTWFHMTRWMIPVYNEFNGYSGDLVHMVEDEFKPVYRFVSGDGSALPEYIKNLLPSSGDKTYATAEEVKKDNPVGLDEKKYTADNGDVWSTNGFSEPVVDSDAKTVTYTAIWSRTQEDKDLTVSLSGDILIDGDTESKSAHKVRKGDTFAFTGSYSIKAIQDKIAELGKSYTDAGGKTADVTVSNVKSSFNALLTIPEGLDLPSKDELARTTLKDNKLFKIDSVTLSGRTITVAMVLQNENYTTFDNLNQDVQSVNGPLEVTIPGIHVGDAAVEGARYTAIGDVTGSFTGDSSLKGAGGNVFTFTFKWNAEQSPEGKDNFAVGNYPENAITYTVEVIKEAQPTVFSVPVSKVDSADTSKTLSGATLAVLKADGTVVDQWTSDGTAHTVNDLDADKVYTIRELSAPKGYKVAADSTFTIDKDGKVTTSAKTAADGTILITDEKRAEGTGKVNVTKVTLKEDHPYSVTDQTFYTALFSDKAFTSRVSDVKEIHLKGTYTQTVTFDGLPYGTYYVAEVTATGAVRTTDPQITKIEVNGGTAKLDKSHKTAEATIINTIGSGVEGELRKVSLTVKKVVKDHDGKAAKVNATFYFGLFLDKDLEQPAEDVDIQKVTLKDASEGKVTFSNLPYTQKYYVAEVDKDGNPVADDDDFAYTVSYSANGIEYGKINKTKVTATNTQKSVETEKPKETETEKPAAVKTGDSSPLAPLTALMVIAACAAIAIIVFRRKKNAQ